MINGSERTREDQLLSSNKTEGIIVAYKKKIYTFNTCALSYDTELDEDEDVPLISGGLGEEVATTLSAYFKKLNAISDFLFIGTMEETSPFTRIAVLPSKYFKDDDSPVDKVLARPTQGDLVIARISLCIPKLRGIVIQEGSFKDNNVVQSITAYHHAASAWFHVQCLIANQPGRVITEGRLASISKDIIPAGTHNVRLYKSPHPHPRQLHPSFYFSPH